MSASILIVDDHEIVREGIRTLLLRSGRDWQVCGEARNGREAVEMTSQLRPDVIVLDLSMPELNGLEAAAQIIGSGARSRVLIFTMHESDRLEPEVRACGAHGYVLKSQAARDLIRAIDALLAGSGFYGTPAEPETTRKEKSGKGGSFFRVTCAYA
jgi:DNA-binding NarL/FixJ family response regulator